MQREVVICRQVSDSVNTVVGLFDIKSECVVTPATGQGVIAAIAKDPVGPGITYQGVTEITAKDVDLFDVEQCVGAAKAIRLCSSARFREIDAGTAVTKAVGYNIISVTPVYAVT